MNDDANTAVIIDDQENYRFMLEREGEIAELIYHLNGKRLVLVHTEVPRSLAGHGIGGQLMQAAVERAKSEGLTVVPWCPYARKWLKDHPDVADTITIDWSPSPA